MVKTISNAKFFEMYKENNSLSIIDVREDYEYGMGHIPGAQSAPLSQFPLQLKNDQTYYVVCQSGGRSAIACQMLKENGYDVINVEDGMYSWKGAVE